jgi:hypothetical protein
MRRADDHEGWIRNLQLIVALRPAWKVQAHVTRSGHRERHPHVRDRNSALDNARVVRNQPMGVASARHERARGDGGSRDQRKHAIADKVDRAHAAGWSG